MESHPRCQVCKKMFKDALDLSVHVEVHKTEICIDCGMSVSSQMIDEHRESHQETASFKAALQKPVSKGKKKDSSKSHVLNSYQVFCRAFLDSKKQMYPTLNMMGINEKLREHWHSLTLEEKAVYKSQPSSSSASGSGASISSVVHLQAAPVSSVPSIVPSSSTSTVRSNV